MSDNLSLARFTFHLKAKTPILLPPYKGSTLRGGFGHAFKRVVCTIKMARLEALLRQAGHQNEDGWIYRQNCF